MPQINAPAKSEGTLELEIRQRIDSLSYLPTTVAVAMKFVELGNNLDAEPADYAQVISADNALNSKILAMANSSWAGVRRRVTNAKTAVNLLGLGTVRTLAISYCMTGLHNELHLTPDESKMFWEASLCKAVAAKKYMSLFDNKMADEAFVSGMFQDCALTVMYAIARERFLPILENEQSNILLQMQRERTLFGMDHAEVGRVLSQKLAMPDLFVDAVSFHHNHERLKELVEDEAFVDAVHVASLFPHILNVWHGDDLGDLGTFLRDRLEGSDPKGYLDDVQTEFHQTYTFFHDGSAPDTQLADLLERVTKEVADNTTRLVGTVYEYMQQAASMGREMSNLLQEHQDLENRASRDPLTGLLNREEFARRCGDLLAKAARYGVGFGVLYLDVDKFKSVNDTYGHEFGDLALNHVAAVLQEVTGGKQPAGRIGGDEFAVLLSDVPEQEARRLAAVAVAGVAKEPVSDLERSAAISVSVGLAYFHPSNECRSVEAALAVADKVMYAAKNAGGNRLEVQIVTR